MAKPKIPRPSSREDLDAFLSTYEERSGLLRLLLETDALGKLHKKKISDSARTLELIRILVEKIDVSGLSTDVWDSLISDDDESVRIPLRFLRPIAMGWEKFTSGEPGYSLSDALKLGSIQGGRIAQSIKADREQFVLAFKIELIRFFAALDGNEMSLEATILDFSEKSGVSESKLRKAHTARIKDVRTINERLGFPITPPK